MKMNDLAQTAKQVGVLGAAVMGLVLSPLASDVLAAESAPSQRQVTLDGAKYFVRGEITKVQDNKYWIETAPGNVKRVEVTKNTHMICPSRNDQVEGEIEIPSGAGFRIGDCPFRAGDMVKVEVSDIGTATFIRELDRDAPTRTEKIGMPQRYNVLPIWPDAMFQTRKVSGYTVKNLDGDKIGHLNKVIIDSTSGEATYGIVELHNGSLMPVPYRSLKIIDETNVVQLQMSKDNLVYAPTFEKEVSVPEMRKFWEREFDGTWEPALTRPFEDQWVKNVVDSLEQRPRLRETLAEYPGEPTRWISLLNRAAEAMNEGSMTVARDYFGHALFAVDNTVDQFNFPKPEAQRIKSAMVLHAPGELTKMVRGKGQPEPSIDMAEAIDIARDEWSGKVINADYLGAQGKNTFRIKLMAGTGVTRLVEVNGDTGKIEKSVIVAGHVMPNEPFR